MLSNLLPSPGVNANVQAGAENTQQIVGSQTRTGDQAQVADQANRVSGTQIINEDLPPWLLLLLVLLAGWAIPSPNEMARGIINFIRMIFGKGPLK